MIELSQTLWNALHASANQPVDLYEIELDAGTVYWADQAITWGGHSYAPCVKSRSAIRRQEGGEFDQVSITLANIDLSMAQTLLTARIDGRRMTIRKVDRSVSGESLVLFVGVCERISRVNEQEIVLSARELLGSVEHECPARSFSVACGWEFKSYECGYAGAETQCNKSWARCAQLGNTDRYGGFRFVPHGGTYQRPVDEVKMVLGFIPRKRTRMVTTPWNAADDTPYDVPIPLIFGRCQVTGIPIQHADSGSETTVLAALGAGTVAGIFFVRANQVAVADWTPHLGQLGGTGSQLPDSRFPAAYPYNLLAYVGVTVPSDVREEDSAPTVTAVVRGAIVDRYNTDGSYLDFTWSDNPIWLVQWFMQFPLAQGGLGLPLEWIDVAWNAREAAYCDELISDTSNSQKIYLPSDLGGLRLGIDYRRFRSTGVHGADPSVDGPYSTYEAGVDDDQDVTPDAVQMRRFTLNYCAQRAEKGVDLLQKRLLPAFRGYLTYSKEGKIRINVERAAANTVLSAATQAGATQVSVAAPAVFAVGHMVVISPFDDQAEVATVSAVQVDRIVLDAPLAFPHASGAVIHRVHYEFRDANLIGSPEYPLSDRQKNVNRLRVKYVDAPLGWEWQEIQINDYAHQKEVRKINAEELDLTACDSYSQAWRVGQWKMAKMRDLGRFISLKAGVGASVMEIGDIVTVTTAEHGLRAVPFRVIELAYEENDEVSVIGQIYSQGVYSDAAPQVSLRVPTVFPPPPAPPTPPGTEPPAEMPTAVTAAAYYEEDRWGVQGTITLPLSRPNLDRLEVWVNGPIGLDAYAERMVSTVPIPGSGNATYKFGADWIRPFSAQSFRVVVKGFNVQNQEAGTIESAQFAVQPVSTSDAVTGCTAVRKTPIEYSSDGLVELFTIQCGWTEPNGPDVIGIQITFQDYDQAGTTAIGAENLAIESLAPGTTKTGYQVKDPVKDTAFKVRCRFYPLMVGRERGPVSATIDVLIQKSGTTTLNGLRIVDGTVVTGKIADGAVSTLKLASQAVSFDKLADLAVQASKLADSAVTATKIANAAVGSAAIAAAAIGTAHIADAAIQTAKIADLAVTSAKIQSLDVSKLTAGTISVAVTMTAPTIQVSGSGFIVDIDSTFGLRVSSSAFSRVVALKDGHLYCESMLDLWRRGWFSPTDFAINYGSQYYNASIFGSVYSDSFSLQLFDGASNGSLYLAGSSGGHIILSYRDNSYLLLGGVNTYVQAADFKRAGGIVKIDSLGDFRFAIQDHGTNVVTPATFRRWIRAKDEAGVYIGQVPVFT